jgi:hypothetical protein
MKVSRVLACGKRKRHVGVPRIAAGEIVSAAEEHVGVARVWSAGSHSATTLQRSAPCELRNIETRVVPEISIWLAAAKITLDRSTSFWKRFRASW